MMAFTPLSNFLCLPVQDDLGSMLAGVLLWDAELGGPVLASASGRVRIAPASVLPQHFARAWVCLAYEVSANWTWRGLLPRRGWNGFISQNNAHLSLCL